MTPVLWRTNSPTYGPTSSQKKGQVRTKIHRSFWPRAPPCGATCARPTDGTWGTSCRRPIRRGGPAAAGVSLVLLVSVIFFLHLYFLFEVCEGLTTEYLLVSSNWHHFVSVIRYIVYTVFFIDHEQLFFGRFGSQSSLVSSSGAPIRVSEGRGELTQFRPVRPSPSDGRAVDEARGGVGQHISGANSCAFFKATR